MNVFEGFPDAEGKFFRALSKNQNKEWFTAHKHEYEEGYVAPMKALLGELRERLEPAFDGHVLGEPKIFRIFRDVRFSKDKTPYKTHIGGYLPILSETGGTPKDGGEPPTPLYLQLGTEAFAGSGAWMMDPSQLDGFRRAVADGAAGKELTRILAKLEKQGFAVDAHGEPLKKVPRGFDPDHPRAELLKRKSLTVRFPALPKEMITKRALATWLTKETAKVAPLVGWLARSQA